MSRRVVRTTVSTEDFQQILAGRERELITILDIEMVDVETDWDQLVNGWTEYNP